MNSVAAAPRMALAEAAASTTAGAAVAARPAASFVPRLEGFRGYGCLMVALVHVWQTPWNATQTLRSAPDLADPFWYGLSKVYAVVFNGHAALTMFFVMSGFVLSRSLDRGPSDPARAGLRFFTARALRIYPSIFGNVALFLAIFLVLGATLPYATAQLFELMSLLKNALALDTGINGVMWTLQLELLAVPIIFFGYLVQRRFGPLPLVLLLVALIALSFSGSWSKLIGANSLGYLHTFVFGLLVPTLGRRLVESLTRRHAGALMLVLAAAFFGAREVLGYASNWAAITEAATSFLLLAGIAYRGELALFRPLDWSLAHYYGRISFSFYLVHPITLIVVWKMPETVAQWLAAGVPSLAIALGLGVLSAVAVTPLAVLCFRLFEAPGMRLIRRLG